MLRTIRIFPGLLAIMLLSACGGGTQTGSVGDVAGVVTDAGTGTALQGVTLSIGGKTAITAAGGLYLIEDVPSGLQDLTATHNGYDPYTGACLVLEGTLVNCNVQMEPAANNIGGVLISARLTPDDAGSNTQIDVIQNPDCDGNISTTDPEPFSNTTGVLTMSLSSVDGGPVPIHYVTKYTVDYIPRVSPAPHNEVFIPPALAGFNALVDIVLNPDAPTSDTITLMPIATKEAFVAATIYLGANYSIRVTLFIVSEFGREATLPVSVDVLLDNFDNCM